MILYRILLLNTSSNMADFKQRGRMLNYIRKHIYGHVPHRLEVWPSLTTVYFFLVIGHFTLDAQNWKGHIASLWPLSTWILRHFEILIANIIFWHTKRWFRSPAEMGQNIPQPPHHSQTCTSTQRWLGPTVSLWMSAREVRPVPVYLS